MCEHRRGLGRIVVGTARVYRARPGRYPGPAPSPPRPALIVAWSACCGATTGVTIGPVGICTDPVAPSGCHLHRRRETGLDYDQESFVKRQNKGIFVAVSIFQYNIASGLATIVALINIRYVHIPHTRISW